MNPILQTLDRYVRSRYPLIVVVTHEETRVIREIDSLMTSHRSDVKSWKPRKMVEWSITTGLVGIDTIPSAETIDPTAAVQALLAYDNGNPPACIVFKDFHPYLDNNPVNVRALRDLYANFATSQNTAIFLSPMFSVPPELEKQMAVIDWPLPDYSALTDVLRGVEGTLPDGIPIKLNGNREKVVQALQGLTTQEATGAITSAIVANRALDGKVIPQIVAEKKQIIRKSGVLEYIETDASMSDVGGLAGLKEYAGFALDTFGTAAKAAGVEPDKGVMIVGVPGTGKSLIAKAIANGRMPLLRMDVGSMMNSALGGSEQNMRQALKVAEAVAPCVLWIDEIEKALGGIGGGETDGGTSLRMFGTLLTWMQETTSPVYVVATANDVRSLRPELLRRFNDVFWVDLPALEDRTQILTVHLSKRGKAPADFDLDRIAKATWGYTGAEIEKVVKTALKRAFSTKTPMTTEMLLDAVGQVIPIAQTMSEEITGIRQWAKGRALMAGALLESRQDNANQSIPLEM